MNKFFSRKKGCLQPFWSSHGMAKVAAMAIVLSLFLGEANAGEDKSARISSNAKDLIEQRQRDAENLKAQLDAEKTPEEKQAVLSEFRAKNAESRKALMAERGEPKSAAQNLAEIKAKAAGNPEMLKRVEKMEERLTAVEELKEAMQAVGEAKEEDKQRLMTEATRKRQALTKLQQVDSEGFKERAKSRESAEARDLPPEMAAMRAKGEERRREVEQLKEALDQATPQEKGRILSEWRAKRQQEMAERKSALDQKLEETKQP